VSAVDLQAPGDDRPWMEYRVPQGLSAPSAGIPCRADMMSHPYDNLDLEGGPD
jgi:hypothetical protein